MYERGQRSGIDIIKYHTCPWYRPFLVANYVSFYWHMVVRVLYYSLAVLFFVLWSVIVAFPVHTHFLFNQYSNTRLKRPFKNRQYKGLMANGSLMKVKSIAECILQYFWPALSDDWAWKPIICLFESGRFRQVLLYITFLQLTSVL